MNRLKCFIFFGLIALSACETEIEFRGLDENPKIVLYSNLNADSIISVSLGVSHTIFNSEYITEQIRDARVGLYRENQLVEFLQYREVPAYNPDEYYEPVLLSGYFSPSGTKPEPGAEYSLRVSLEGFPDAEAFASLPEGVEISFTDREIVEITEYDYTYSMMKIKLGFTDPPETENYYRLVLRQQSGYYPGERTEEFNPEIPVLVSENYTYWITSNDPLLFPSEDESLFGSESNNQYLVFSDEKINGKNYELAFSLGMDPAMPDTSFHEFVHYEIILQSLSPDFYYYLVSLSKYHDSEGDFLAEPVLLFSNVNHGLGVFSGATSSATYAHFGEYPVNGVLYMKPEDYWGYK